MMSHVSYMNKDHIAIHTNLILLFKPTVLQYFSDKSSIKLFRAEILIVTPRVNNKREGEYLTLNRPV